MFSKLSQKIGKIESIEWSLNIKSNNGQKDEQNGYLLINERVKHKEENFVTNVTFKEYLGMPRNGETITYDLPLGDIIHSTKLYNSVTIYDSRINMDE